MPTSAGPVLMSTSCLDEEPRGLTALQHLSSSQPAGENILWMVKYCQVPNFLWVIHIRVL